MNETRDFSRGALGAATTALVLALSFAAPAGATMPTAAGQVAPEVAGAFEAGLFALPEHAVAARTSAAQTRWNIPVLLVGFSDAPLTYGAAGFETELFDTTGANPHGSVSEYYRWVSNGRLTVTGRVVGVIQLPNPRNYYAYWSYGLARESTPENQYGMVRDALLASDPSIDWSEFDVDHDGWVDMLWVVHQGIGGENTPDRTTFWSITSRMTGGWRFGAPFETEQLLPGSTRLHYQIDRFSTMPELSGIIPGRRSEIGVYCHEFGHALGLPDLYDTSGLPAGVVNVGPGNWSLMSTGGYGGQGLTPERPTHLGAWCLQFLGWRGTVRPAQDTLVTMRPIARGDPFVEFWFQGESNPEHILIENRALEGNDATLPSGGLVLYHVDEAAIAQRLAGNHVNAGLTPGLMLIEGDGRYDMWYGLNHGDGSDPYPGSRGVTGIGDFTLPSTRTFAGAVTNIALGQIQMQGDNVQFRAQVRAPGWESERNAGPPSSDLFDSARPARWMRTDAQRRTYAVRSEVVAGVPQVVLLTREGSTWQGPVTVSASPAGAYDPTLACLPGGDLAVAWTDVRGGRASIWLRVRIRGVWQPEQSLAELPGNGHHAAIGADAHGMVQVAWIQENQGTRGIVFKRFAYTSPFGSPSPITFPGEAPDPPALEVRPNGASYLVWSDRAEATARVYYARFHPDSGVTARIPLTGLPSAPQFGVAAAVDAGGDLLVAWQANATGVNELHFQRRPLGAPPVPRDTVLASAGYLLQNPAIACDDSGGVHLVYEDWRGQAPRPVYRLWTAARGWDWGGTQVGTSDWSGLRPAVHGFGPSDVLVLYTRDSGGMLQLVQRTRRLGLPPTTDVPVAVASPPARGWELAPNPLRAGARLMLAASGDGARFEIFDLAGRRVAEAAAATRGERRFAEIPASATASWPGGIYFARLAGARESRRFVVLH